MLRVNLSNDPDVLLRLVRHHARSIEGIVLELFASMMLVLGQDDETWDIKQSRIGANSFSLHGRGRSFHFRSTDTAHREIVVYDRARAGNIVAVLRTRDEARRFVRGLVPAKVVQAA